VVLQCQRLPAGKRNDSHHVRALNVKNQFPTFASAVFCATVLVTAAPLPAQSRPAPALEPAATVAAPRPIPGPVFEIPGFTRAIQRQTRTRTGQPGARYWVQHARYRISARFDPATNRLTGSESLTYLNESPDTLRRLAIYVRQNAYAAGSPRRQQAPITGGVTLQRVALDGVPMQPANTGAEAVPIVDQPGRRPATQGYTIDGTVLWIPLMTPLLPHDSAVLEFAWTHAPPPAPADGRQGREGNVVYMGYWYPQMAVYDDVNSWVADPFLLEAEFYMDPADYDVQLTVPRGWVVDATGTLLNAHDVLSARTLERLVQARRTGAVVRILTPGADADAALANRGITATWHFKADNMRDFAWGTSDEWAWDATRALVHKSATAAPDTVDIHSFFRLSAAAAAWAIGGARFTRDAIERLSDYLWPYPWPKMSSMEGILDSGGMEYPMLTIMQPWADTLSLAGDLTHETGHMWFPMQVGSSETRYPWMDEGFTTFDVAQAMRAQYGSGYSGGRPGDSEAGQRMLYLRAARDGNDMPLMWPGDLYPQDLYFIMFYDKTAQVLAALRGLLGDAMFQRAYREYGMRWIGRHPYPYDFFNTVSDVAGRDLGWFWQTWFFHDWSLDQAIGAVTQQGDSLAITIEDRGLAPMPVRLAITRASGPLQRIEVPVDVWLAGARRCVVHVAATPAVTQIEIDPEGAFPDVDRSNQIWKGQAADGSAVTETNALPLRECVQK
jgi:hypothetical protein